MKRAIKNHSGDFAAILVLLVLSVVVAGYILSHERLRFPFIQSSPITMNAEFSTAQAVTPGQGQTVRVSGVQIGSIGAVTLKNGIAIVQLQIDQQYKHLIHTDATALLRPRTGLKDMFIELNPGSKSTPVAKSGFTIPVSNTLPDINLDEILASLDADTRAYLDLLVNGAGQGLSGNGGNELAQVLARFEPTHRDLARLNKAIAVRGTNLSRLVNSLQRLNTALAAKQNQIVQLVDSSSHVFRAFASEDQNISRAVADLPGTLSQTTATLAKVQSFANQLGPAATNLLPAARALPAANQALTALAVPSTPIVKNQIRPFVIASRPVVRNLKPASVNLANATPNLSNAFTVINHLVNLLGYSPGGGQHGYLWWLAWLGHNARTLFSVQDANGVYRPLFIQFNCTALLQILNSPSLGVVGALLNLAPLKPLCTGLGANDKQSATARGAGTTNTAGSGSTARAGAASPGSASAGAGAASPSSASARAGAASPSSASVSTPATSHPN
jgi:phospholipid/cholesterol/gamma-HCH transport system substrate-binding protein